VNKYTGPIVDSDIHFGPKSRDGVMQYLPERWREYFEGGGQAFAHCSTTGAMWGGVVPNSAMLRDSYPEDGEFGPGSDYDFTKEQVLDRHNHWRVILSALNASELLNPWAGVVWAKALNEWVRDSWLSNGDDRLYSVICLPPSDAEVAAAEVRRFGDNPRFVALQPTGGINALPCGHPVYDPIYDAACEYDLPYELHPNGSGHYRMPSGPINTAAAGVPMSLTAFAMHHLSSLIVHGTFEKFPTLRVVVKEHGVLFLAHLMWRLDRNYKELKAESPWVKKLPSEYLMEHVWIGSHPLEQGFRRNGSDVAELLEATPGLEDRLIFCSDYPHMNYDDAAFVSGRLPAGWHRKVMLENTCILHNWEAPAETLTDQELVGAGRS
jgi:predicted TIM-barrel fold metal-dependent hydrolase